MRFILVIIMVVSTVIPFGSLSAQGRNKDFVLNRGDLVEDLLLQYYDLYHFNGAVLVAVDDEVIYENSLGFADYASAIPLDSETPFYLASLAKQFTAVAVMKLTEEGSIDLNEPITSYLPRLPEFYTEVKISNLLNHTSGVPDYLNSPLAVRELTNQEVYHYLENLKKLEFQPGAKFRYSNSGYVLLAMVVEVASGYTIEDYFTKVLFQDMGMPNTFIYTPNSVANKRAYGFSDKEKPDDYQLFTVGDGGFYSTTTDLFNWLQGLNRGEVISKASLEAMYKPVRLSNGRQKRYGYGWELGTNTSGQFVYHTGQLAGFRTYIERQNSNGTTIIILTNNSFEKIAELRNKLVKILDGRLKRISEE